MKPRRKNIHGKPKPYLNYVREWFCAHDWREWIEIDLGDGRAAQIAVMGFAYRMFVRSCRNCGRCDEKHVIDLESFAPLRLDGEN